MRPTALAATLLFPACLAAQDNYEIQVYASPTMDKGVTMFEWHSNFTVDGRQGIKDGVRPTYHAYHGTLEITHGFTNNFECGLYLFTNATSPYGWQWVGIHLRPRITAPESWKLPFGASLSTEFGYQRLAYSSESWNIEIRPILDKTWGKWYIGLNPTVGIQLKGEMHEAGPSFEPNVKVSFAASPKISVGTEYYGDMGPINQIDPGPEQSHTLYAVADLFLDPRWELNFGPGWGLTPATDRLVIKLILGRRIEWHSKQKEVAKRDPQFHWLQHG